MDLLKVTALSLSTTAKELEDAVADIQDNVARIGQWRECLATATAELKRVNNKRKKAEDNAQAKEAKRKQEKKLLRNSKSRQLGH